MTAHHRVESVPIIPWNTQTCKLNAVDPYAYPRATLAAIANRHPAPRIDNLMPWAFQKQSSEK
jgi:hypothetical protein